MSNMKDFVIENDVLKEYRGPGGDVVIPEGVIEMEMGWEVEALNPITSVTLPSTLDYIHEHFGYGVVMKPLTNLVINGPYQIEGGLFVDCKKLTTVVIGKNVRHIKKNAFKGCKKLKEVHFMNSQNAVNIECFAFPENVELFYEDSSEKKDTLNKDTLIDGIPLQEAKKYMKLKKERDGYKVINADTKNIRTIIANDHELGVFEDFTDTHVVRIPAFIEGIPVTHISALLIPDDAVVFCPGMLFPKLTRATKITTVKEWLAQQSLFPENMNSEIVKFIKRYKQDVLNSLSGSESLRLYQNLFKYISLTRNDITTLLSRPVIEPEIQAYLLQQTNLTPPENDISLKTPKRTVADLKKLWTVQKLQSGKTNEIFYRITHYKGNETTVTVPAMIGRTPVKEIYGSIFDVNCPVKEIKFEPNSEINLNCNLRNAVHLADSNGYITIHLNGHVYLTNYIENQRVVRIPEYVTDVLYYTFHDNIYVENIIIPDGPTSASIYVDQYNDSLKEIHISASIKELVIYVSVFAKQNLTIFAPSGSYAETYAKENNIPFVAE